MTNRAFNHATALLAHPLSLAAIALMLINDALLKQLYPSWLTGKLSDAAGLFFMPLMLAALLAWLIPAGRRQVRLTGALAFAAVGLTFAAAKTIPAFNLALVQAVQPVLGTVYLVPDSTDLLTLPALAAAAWLWQKKPALPRNPAHSTPHAWRWAVIPLAMIVTLADAAAPDPGIACLSIEQNRLEAGGGYGQVFTSTDGGLSWQDGQAAMQFSGTCSAAADPMILVEQPGSQVRYRITRDQQIERSGDNGQTWVVDYHLSPATEAEKAYVQRTRSGSPIEEPLPLQAVFDPTNGNLVLAMGQEGALVRTAGGEWLKIPVGPYAPLDLQRGFWAVAGALLSGEVVLGAAAALLGIAALAASLKPRRRNNVLIILGWMGLALIAVVFPPALTAAGYLAPFIWIALLILTLYTVFCTVLILVGARDLLSGQAGRHWPALLGVGMAADLAFLLPFLLWVAGFLPYYYLALALGAVLLVIVLLVGKRPALGQPAA